MLQNETIPADIQAVCAGRFSSSPALARCIFQPDLFAVQAGWKPVPRSSRGHLTVMLNISSMFLTTFSRE